ncbi:MAG: gamma-glutamyltransferase [Planctomycetota bacterium]|nr:MAG: gamma-glutamyltransferase [Planctomycetota bacterium]
MRRPARTSSLLCALLLAPAACQSGPAVRGPAPVVHGSRAMVAADHPEAARIGAEVLARGGNAADAAVAVALAIAVSRPESAGLGGGAFILVKPPGAAPAVAIDARETAPAAARLEQLRDARGRVVAEWARTGARAVATPGLLAGLVRLWREHGSGRLGWAELVAPAIELARRGVVVDAFMHERMRKLAERLAAAEGGPAAPAAAGGAPGEAGATGRRSVEDPFAETRRSFLGPGGEPLPVGARLVQPALAATLAEIAADPEALYRGRLARRLAARVERAGGWLAASDLARYRAVVREPVVAEVAGLRVYAMPPPSSGGAVMVQVLRALAAAGLLPEPAARATGATPRGAVAPVFAPEFAHAFVECLKHAYADRATLLGDPDDPEHGPAVRAAARAMIAPEHAARVAAALRHGPLAPAAYGLRALRDRTGGTSHLSVLDAQGGAVALTMSINLSYGSLITCEGIVLNDHMDDFTLDPAVPNEFGLLQSERNLLRAGRRPLSSMTPVVVTDARTGRVVLVAGAAGGPRIITATLHTALRHAWFGEPLARAVAAPRYHHQWMPDLLMLEPGVPAPTVAALRARGHRTGRYPADAGRVNAVGLGDDGRTLVGAGSPRGGGAAAGF